MARYIVRRSFIDIVGGIWWPYGATCSLRKDLSQYDIDNMRDEDGEITRESVEQWVCLNSGDFSSILDFSASIEDGDRTIDLEWATEDGETAYLDTLGGGDDEC
jgi:hypothetical protein